MIAVAHGQSLVGVGLSAVATLAFAFGGVGVAMYRDKWRKAAR